MLRNLGKYMYDLIVHQCNDEAYKRDFTIDKQSPL